MHYNQHFYDNQGFIYLLLFGGTFNQDKAYAVKTHNVGDIKRKKQIGLSRVEKGIDLHISGLRFELL